MAATRLSDSQKQELVARFCGGASLQQLATLFGCSPTTVSRTAKAAIDLADYELLLKQLKAQRGGSSRGDGGLLAELPLDIETDQEDGARPEAIPASEGPGGYGDASDIVEASDIGAPTDIGEATDVGEAVGAAAALTPSERGEPPELATTGSSHGLEEPAEAVAQPAVVTEVSRPILGRRRRSGAATPSTPATPLPDADQAAPNLSGQVGLQQVGLQQVGLQAELDPAADPAPVAAGPGELAIDDADDFGADDAEDGEDDLSDDPGEEICFAQAETFVAIPVGPIIDDLAIHEAVPFSAAVLPSSAFLLVDKTVELQARPLRELPELGRLAADELDRQALVVFVNPRQAKRQCGRTQRVIPLPDPSLLERTAPYLMAQGITRLVIEGALYALPGA
ncbi:MAG: hypothetical protein ACK5QQ_14110 [Cyanobacteriota bacterium]